MALIQQILAKTCDNVSMGKSFPRERDCSVKFTITLAFSVISSVLTFLLHKMGVKFYDVFFTVFLPFELRSFI